MCTDKMRADVQQCERLERDAVCHQQVYHVWTGNKEMFCMCGTKPQRHETGSY